MKTSAAFSMVLLIAGVIAEATLVTVPLDQQINLGYTYNSQSPAGNAIYAAFNADTQTFSPGSHVRHNLVAGGGAGGWWYQYVDLNLAGLTTPGNGLNLSAANARVEFDARFYQDPVGNSNPYADAPIFLRIYTYAADGNTYRGHRDFSIVYNTATPWADSPYPTWTHVTVDINSAAFTDSGSFDVGNVSRIRFYGTDWTGTGTDFVDFKNLSIGVVPEPSTISVLLLAFGTLVCGLKRRENG